MELLFLILMLGIPFAVSLIVHCEQMDELSRPPVMQHVFRAYFFRGLIKPCLLAVLVFLIIPSLVLGPANIYIAITFLIFVFSAIGGCLLSWLMVGAWWYRKARRDRTSCRTERPHLQPAAADQKPGSDPGITANADGDYPL